MVEIIHHTSSAANGLREMSREARSPWVGRFHRALIALRASRRTAQPTAGRIALVEPLRSILSTRSLLVKTLWIVCDQQVLARFRLYTLDSD